MERIGRTNFLQKREIEQQNALLQERVREQRAELIQIEKAVASTSDAIGIFSTSGELTYKNQAFEDLLIPKDASRDGGVPFDDIVARALSLGSCEGEREAGGAPEQKKVLLIQADAVQDEEGRSIGVVVTCRDITERKDAEEKMRYLSFHDQLTGLFNRTWFDEELQRLDKVRQLPLSLIMADLNGLKLVNDTYGHAMGDSFLQACAGILKQACRGEDIILHDIGKINMPVELLRKNTALTPEEWEIMRQHPEIGYRIARSTDEVAHVAGEILSHHERWDGTGYPRKLKGKDIPLLARITTLVDAVEVMQNGRPYKQAMTSEEIRHELIRCAGTQFDPDFVKELLEYPLFATSS